MKDIRVSDTRCSQTCRIPAAVRTGVMKTIAMVISQNAQSPALAPWSSWRPAAEDRHGIADDGDHDHHVGAVERHVTVRGGDLRAVGEVVHRSQGVQEALHASAEEGHHAGTERPQHGSLVRVPATTTVDHVEREDGHGEEGIGSSAEKIEPHPLPVFRRADPEVVVAVPMMPVTSAR